MTTATTVVQQAELVNLLQTPLTGKRVMIPMTSKAFFAGTLQPTTTTTPTKTTSTSTSKKEEQVVMHLGKDYYVEMTRSEAVQHLSPRSKYASKQANASSVESKTTTQTAPTTTMKASSDGATPSISSSISKSADATGAAAWQPSGDSPSLSSLPPQQQQKQHHQQQQQQDQQQQQQQQQEQHQQQFFEIKEEYDNHGREIRSEAINVGKELEYFSKQLEASKNGGGGKTTPTSRTGKPPPTATNMEEGAAAASIVEEGPSGELHERGRSNDVDVVTDDQYQVMSNRMEELERLEEQAEHKQRTNQTSSLKLQSKGWGKGFLNSSGSSSNKKSSNKSKNRNNKNKNKQQPPFAKAIESTTGIEVARQLQQTQQDDDEEAERSKKVVAFESNDQVREIPRIGEKSLSAIVPPKPVQAKERQHRKLLEKDVFTGVVQERPVARSSGNTNTNSNAPPPRTKKLSKFAQQRQDQQEW